ncbi:hypothetical protein [Thiohalophilus thiocyanatoxydans]|uniref:Uncharacterized protein n=1 Tax=Thiohalophilus thiocyanatoxydans TaxID=381308 RepID=A0A4R8IJP8_9GAMM|nr:hypothetical protein [Thiohalophilus thiocyanatoxydans]TDY00951.1 hypothetical protein EDC23_1696 [Thiohalophilus thiocyanatoxydans]
MTTKLVQKHLFKGTREFEIVNDVINVRMKTPFKEEKITVGLTVLDPEPVINKPYLEFNGRAESEPMLSLFLDKPNTEEFNAFVVALQKQILAAGNAVSGLDADSYPAGIAGNVYEEPPEFEESDQKRFKYNNKSIDAAKLESAIQMLERYVEDEEIKPLLFAMNALKDDPKNESCMEQVVNAFNELGIVQGAVLTYAPYISVLLMDDPYGDN